MSEAETPKQINPEETASSEANDDLAVRTVDISAPSQPETTPIERFEQRITPEAAEADPEVSAKDSSRLPPLKEADWFSLARKLRQRNRDLLKKVASLEKALADSQEALQAEIGRSRSMEAMGAQQAKELSVSQEKIDLLLGELEISRQDARNQQISINQLSADLERSRQHIVQLERDCDRLQQQYAEQTSNIQEAQQQSRELYIRLQRQQRQTLQFKAALDKCLNTQISAVAGSVAEEEESPERSTTPIPLTIVAQPVQPWSNPNELSDELSEQSPAWAASTWSEDSPEEESYLDDAAIAEQMALFDLEPDAKVSVVPTEEDNWETDLDPTSPAYDAVDWLLEAIDVPSSTLEEDASVKSELALELAEEGDSQNLATVEAEPTEPAPSQWQPSSAPANPSPPSSSPSPLIYPRRSQTRRKTFAAIDLPNFPRWNPSQT